MDTFFDTHEAELTVPGLEEAVTLFQISDTHLCVIDPQTSPEEAAYLTERETARLGSRKVHSWDAFDRLTSLAVERRADMILSTGDLMENMHGGGIRFLRKRLETLPLLFLTTPGNHEDAACEGLWTEGVQVVDYPGFRIVAADNRLRTFTDGVLDRLDAVLREKIPVILMMHIPFLTSLNADSSLGRVNPYYRIGEDTCDENTARFLSMLRETDTVRLLLCGHVHVWTDSCPIEGLRQITVPYSIDGGALILSVHG